MPSERRQRLRELEAVIGSGFDHAVEAGRALQEIRDQALYLELGPNVTFEGYCRSRWSMVASRAYQLLDAADISDAISTTVENMAPNTEWAARELAPLLRQGGKPLVAEAWSKVVGRYEGQRPPTAREIHDVLVAEGYRDAPAIGPSSGKVNRRIRLGQFGDKLIAAEKRLNWFVTHELGDRPLAKLEQQMARDYAARCLAMARSLEALAGDEP
jgi:hypothetical protein